MPAATANRRRRRCGAGRVRMGDYEIFAVSAQLQAGVFHEPVSGWLKSRLRNSDQRPPRAATPAPGAGAMTGAGIVARFLPGRQTQAGCAAQARRLPGVDRWCSHTSVPDAPAAGDCALFWRGWRRPEPGLALARPAPRPIQRSRSAHRPRARPGASAYAGRVPALLAPRLPRAPTAHTGQHAATRLGRERRARQATKVLCRSYCEEGFFMLTFCIN